MLTYLPNNISLQNTILPLKILLSPSSKINPKFYTKKNYIYKILKLNNPQSLILKTLTNYKSLH